MSDELTKGGQQIIRGVAKNDGWTPPEFDAEIRAAVEEHLLAFLGHSTSVWHEIISDLVHIDVYLYEPTASRPFFTLVTSGMSDRPMNVPEGLENAAYAELMICLPFHWKLGKTGDISGEGDLADFDNYWPIHTLKYLARLPHVYSTWLGWGHSILNGDPARPIAETEFVGTVIGPVTTLPDDFAGMEIDGRVIWFYAVYPVYAEELQFKIDTASGGDALFELFEGNGITELIDVHRKNVVSGQISE